MKYKPHDCPYLQGKQTCCHKSQGKRCIFNDPKKCPCYRDWLQDKETYEKEIKIKQGASNDA